MTQEEKVITDLMDSLKEAFKDAYSWCKVEDTDEWKNADKLLRELGMARQEKHKLPMHDETMNALDNLTIKNK